MKFLTTALAATAAIGLAAGANAANLVVNGGFESTTNGLGQLGFNTDATGWSIAGGYTFLFAAGTADNGGANGQYGNLQLWGPNNGSANGLPASSPDGGNFVALDGAFQQAPITQTINGLTVGKVYKVSFFWGGAQQNGFTGDTTEQFQVSLGGDTQSTAILNNVSHGFTGWQSESFKYKASNTSEVLSFLAVGTPAGVPPFSVLDGVSLSAVPEPVTWALMLVGIAGVGGAMRARRRGVAVAA